MNTINYVLNYIKYTLVVMQDECEHVETILQEINQHRSVQVFVRNCCIPELIVFVLCELVGGERIIVCVCVCVREEQKLIALSSKLQTDNRMEMETNISSGNA